MENETFFVPLQQSLGSHIPTILGAIFIFIIGWLIAVVARAGTRRLLAMMGVNRRIEESTGSRFDAEHPVAVGVFWLIILGAVIAALNTLNLSSLSNPFSHLLTDILGYLPHLLAGLILALVAWLIATVLRAAVTKALQMTSMDDRLSAAAGMAPMSRNVGNVLFWLVLLLFLPSILGAFRLGGTLGPVQLMLTQALDMIPNIFAAALIAFVGWVVARVLRGLVVNLLSAAGVDRLMQRPELSSGADVTPGTGFGTTAAPSVGSPIAGSAGSPLGSPAAPAARIGTGSGVSLSRLAGTLVFILVLVPSLIAALEALQIEAISGPATLMLGKLLNAVPNIIAAIVIVLITWYVARFIASLLARLLESAGADTIPQRIGMGQAMSGNTRPSKLAHWAVMLFAMLFAVVEAADQLGFYQVRDVVTGFIRFGGDIILGGLILVIGYWLANLAYSAISRASGENTAGLASVARIAILGVVIAMGLRAMGIANEIVQLAFGLTLGAVAVAVALSFGLGGREAAGKLTEHWVDRWRAKKDRRIDLE